MALQVQGVLIDPVGKPLPYVEIRITTVESTLAHKGAEAYVVTGSEAQYDFGLEAGTYTVELLQDDEFTVPHTIVSTGSGTTDLPTLIRTGIAAS